MSYGAAIVANKLPTGALLRKMPLIDDLSIAAKHLLQPEATHDPEN
ncbi:hypothetical protein D088_710035 [Salmonella enterica subsp. houtenae serovar 16:z4,z32:-- str. RKS3027]|nr:hypothetical protein D088_710035 [Salmonella enterica subsp. houtenae serovar 16:z4,z32:-- str. RKS3027]